MTVDPKQFIKREPPLPAIAPALFSTKDEHSGKAWRHVGDVLLGHVESSVLEFLCFFDVVFVAPTPDAPSASRGFLYAAGKTTSETYRAILTEQLLPSQHDVAGHPVFACGLPQLVLHEQEKPEQIETQSQLEALCRDQQLGSADRIRRSYFRSTIHRPVNRWIAAIGRFLSQSETIAPHVESFNFFDYLFDRKGGRGAFGGNEQSILTNLSVFEDLLRSNRSRLHDLAGRPLGAFWAVPVCSWLRNTDGTPDPRPGGSFFLGFSVGLTKGIDYELDIVRGLHGPISETVGALHLRLTSEREGIQKVQTGFAHQTVRVVRRIIYDLGELPGSVRESLVYTVAALELLKTVLISYASIGQSDSDVRFSYPWKPGDSPLDTYQDIALRIAIQRAVNASDEAVRNAGRFHRRKDLAPDKLKTFKASLLKKPEYTRSAVASQPPEMLDDQLKKSRCAVLLLLALGQAIYHTLRAKELDSKNIRVSVTVDVASHGAFSCTIVNPQVDKDGYSEQTSKDAPELQDLAQRLSSNNYRYTVEGPRRVCSRKVWTTTITFGPVDARQIEP